MVLSARPRWRSSIMVSPAGRLRWGGRIVTYRSALQACRRRFAYRSPCVTYRRLCLEVSSETYRHVRSSLSLFPLLRRDDGMRGGMLPRPFLLLSFTVLKDSAVYLSATSSHSVHFLHWI